MSDNEILMRRRPLVRIIGVSERPYRFVGAVMSKPEGILNFDFEAGDRAHKIWMSQMIRGVQVRILSIRFRDGRYGAVCVLDVESCKRWFNRMFSTLDEMEAELAVKCASFSRAGFEFVEHDFRACRTAKEFVVEVRRRNCMFGEVGREPPAA